MGIGDIIKRYGILVLGVVIGIIGIIGIAVGAFKRGYNNVDTTNITPTKNATTGVTTTSGVVVGATWRYMFYIGLGLAGAGLGLLLGGLVLAFTMKPVVAVVKPTGTAMMASRRSSTTIV